MINMRNMKNKVLQLFFLVALMTTTACNDKYPDLEDGLYAEFVTNKGTMVAKLYFDKVPVTVANFVALAEGNHPMVKEEFKEKKYYNGTTFHRVIDQFMIQGGDPTATGSGDPGYKFEDEFHPDLKHDKPGILSMANSGPATNGSQFFITEVPTPNLNNRHAVFGELVLGLEIQDSISNVETSKPGDKPKEDVVIQELNIIRKGSAAKNFDAPKVYMEELPKIKEKQKALREEAKKKAEEERLAKEAQNAEAGAAFKATLDGYEAKATTLPSGLKMFVITEGTGEKPNTGDMVKVNYEGYFADGRLFDSNVKDVSERHGMFNEMRDQQGGYQPMPMKVSPDANMIPGFKEGVAALKGGDRAYFYLPYHLAYGERAMGPIPAKSDLIFIIELVEDAE